MKKNIFFGLLITGLSFSCSFLRERKAEHHQPFKDHKENKGHAAPHHH
jgi:hypothetical protein